MTHINRGMGYAACKRILCGSAFSVIFWAVGSAAVLAQPADRAGDNSLLHVTVPVGAHGTLTVPGVQDAQARIRQVPGGAAVVPAADFQDGYALSLKDVLETTPGIFVQPRWGEEVRLSIRGSGLSRGFHMRGISLLQDGIPIHFSDGSADFQELDPLVVQHTEVYRGGQGLRYGAATLGGAVNMVTPSAHTLGHRALLRFEGGSFNTARAHAQAAHIFGDVDVFAGVTRTVSQGYRQQSEQNNQRFNGNAGIRLGDRAETRFYLSWNDIEQEVPGTLSKQDARRRPKSVAPVNIAGDYARDVRSLRLSNRTAVQFDNGLTGEVGGFVNDKSLYHPIFQVLDQDSRDVGAFTRLSGRQGAHDFTVGLTVTHGVNDADRYLNVGGRRGLQTMNTKQEATQLDLYGENRIRFAPDWDLILGLQGTMARRVYQDHNNAANDDSHIYRSLNSKLGVMWQAARDAEIYASVTRSSEAPTFSELVQGAVPGFIPLAMQTAWTAEIGTRGTRGAFSWDATLYHARVKDEMLQYAVGPDIPASTFNADDTIHQGIELGVAWQATARFRTSLVYNLNDFHFRNDAQYGDNKLAGAPPHQIRAAVRFEDGPFHVEPHMDYIPQAGWVDYANTLKADNYAVFGVKAGWDITDSASLFVDARNLTDKKHLTSYSTITDARVAGTNVFYPGDGRSVFAGLQVKF